MELDLKLFTKMIEAKDLYMRAVSMLAIRSEKARSFLFSSACLMIKSHAEEYGIAPSQMAKLIAESLAIAESAEKDD